MKELKLKLLIDAVLINKKRYKVTVEEALTKYPTLTNEEKAAITAALQ